MQKGRPKFFRISPFNEARYRALLEGLEVSEVKLSEVLNISRFDSEYFRPDLIKLQKRLEELAHTTIGSQSEFVVGPFGSEFHVENYNKKSGFRYIRGKDVKSFFIETDDNVYIPENDYRRLFNHSVKENDILVSVVGTLGNSCIVVSENLPSIFSCKSTIIRNPGVNPFYLLSFLNSRIGKTILVRNARGAVQLGLNLSDIKQLPIPLFGNNVQLTIEKIIKRAKNFLSQSKVIYKEAEQTLLRALGLENWQPPDPLTYTRTAADTFAVGRLDAEYFRPKYDSLITAIKADRRAFDLYPLGELSEPLKYGCSDQLEYVEEGRIFLRIADLKNKRFEANSVFHVPIETEFRESELVQEGDVLISRSGTLGIAVPIIKNFSGSAYGSYFIRTRPDKSRLNPEFLSLFINSLAGKLQVEGKNTGGVQTNLTIPAIESLLIPVGSIEWQMQFVDKVNSSITIRNRAQSLLESAKHAVEIAIEQNEETAMNYLKEQDAAYA